MAEDEGLAIHHGGDAYGSLVDDAASHVPPEATRLCPRQPPEDEEAAETGSNGEGAVAPRPSPPGRRYGKMRVFLFVAATLVACAAASWHATNALRRTPAAGRSYRRHLVGVSSKFFLLKFFFLFNLVDGVLKKARRKLNGLLGS